MNASTEYTILGNYNISEGHCIHNGPHSKVYRTLHNSDQQPVILKMLKGEADPLFPTPKEIGRFRREYTIARKLQGTNGVIEVYDLQEYENTLVIIMEDGGESLNKVMSRGPLGLEEFLRLAIQITEALTSIHPEIIHKDINPTNIVRDPDTKQIKIIDFGISVEIPKEQAEASPPAFLEGTLNYISPEQTGRMNRAIDYRSDYYSLGATFYHVLTGQLPFDESEDLRQLVHYHIAKRPTPPHEIMGREADMNSEGEYAGSPLGIVSRIIMKLMKKGAEERYQSASGLKADLEYVRDHLTDPEMISRFEIARNDIFERFEISQKLYGREKELEELLATFDRVSAGETELTLVSGHAGVGKSRLVNELHKPVVAKRSYFIAGKDEQYQNNAPYSVIIQAFKKLVSDLLAESSEQLAEWKEQLLEALGSNGQLILDVIPELEMIIGPQPEADEVSPENARNRFLLTFQAFARTFASESHPLVIVLDDLQWADQPSLQLLETLITDPEARCMFFVGAYRDNKPEEIHSVLLTVNRLKEAGARINEILLSPLSPEHVNTFLVDTLKAPAATCRPLAEFLLKRTDNGNPFFLTLYLRTLHEKGLFTIEQEQKSWEWNLAAIRKAEIPEDIVEIMAGSFQTLPEKSRKILALAACIGHRFDLHTLSIVCRTSQEETMRYLWDALQNELIFPLDNSYKYVGRPKPEDVKRQNLNASFKFPHDRVQQAAYSLIKEEHKHEVHLEIGQLLLKQSSSSEQEERLLEIVNHLNRGRDLVKERAEKEQLVQLNLRAGQKTKTADPQLALKYLQVGLELLEEGSWKSQYKLTLILHVEATESACLSGDFEQVEQLFQVVLQHARTLLDKVKMYEIKIQAHIAQGKFLKTVQIALRVLRLLGVTFPQKPNKLHIYTGLLRTQYALAGEHIEDLANLPEMSDPYKLAIMRILVKMATAAYIAIPKLLPLIGVKGVRLSLRHGVAVTSAYILAGYGLILGVFVGNIPSQYDFGKMSLSLLERWNTREFESRTIFVFNGLIRHWKEPIKETLDPLLRAYKQGQKTGDLDYAALSVWLYTRHAYFIGKKLTELEREMMKYDEEIGRLKQDMPRMLLQIDHQAVLNLLGKADDPCRLQGKACDEDEVNSLHPQENHRLALFSLYCAKLYLCYLFAAYPQAVDNAARAETYLDGVIGMIIVPVFHFYDSLARLAIFPGTLKSKQRRILKRVAANQKKMKKWAFYAPMNHLHKWHLIEAERARVLGKDAEAIKYYIQAIRGAREHEYVNEEALANELMAKFWFAKDMKPEARARMAKARYCYHKWGATAKVRHLEKTYPELFDLLREREEPPLKHETRQTTKRPETTTILSGSLEKETLNKALKISREIRLEEFLPKMMQIVMENAGAQKGVFIEQKDHQWVIQAIIEEETVSHLLCALTVDHPDLVPRLIIHSVCNTKDKVVIDDVLTDTQFRTDPYIQTHQPKSILCLPVKSKGELIAILYLEHKQAARVFTPERTDMLELLSWQIAISLDNARLYNTLEQRVQERTAELEEAMEAAKAANQKKDDFLANMNHELRTPLNGILGYADLLKEDRTLTEQQHKKIEAISRSSKNILTLLTGALDITRIEVDKLELEPKDFHLRRFLKNISEMFEILAQQKDIALLSDFATELPICVCGDEKLLRQVLLNILGNAVKFTKEGSIAFRVYPAPVHDNAVSSPEMLMMMNIRFQVEDTGVGIDPKNFDVIFRKFGQVDERHQKTGAGLGLTISRNFVQLMGSDIQVHSELGKGSIFRFDLELPIGENVVEESIEPFRYITGFKCFSKGSDNIAPKIMIVDDDLTNLAVLRDRLMLIGFDLIEAGNGREALDLAKQQYPDLILMDIFMPPGMSGIETTYRIRQIPELVKIIIIGISASPQNQQESLAPGYCDAFLEKPVDRQKLYDTLARYLQIEWVYEETLTDSFPNSTIHIVAPALDELKTLHRLAKLGNMPRLREHAAYLQKQDIRYRPFTDVIQELARTYKKKRIIAFVEQHMGLEETYE